MTKAERVEMYLNYLKEEGFSPKIDNDGDVMFRYEGGNYYITADEQDEAYFRIMYPSFWSVETEEERKRAVHASVAASAETKVAKVYISHGKAVAAVEMFCTPPDVFKRVLMRTLSAMQTGAAKFREKMKDPA